MLCYNESHRIPEFLEHHRSIGVSWFIFVDFGSTDSSREILGAQQDVELLTTSKSYKDFKGPIRNTIADQLFNDKWILFLDVDEKFIWSGIEQNPIKEFVRELDRSNAEGVFAIMVEDFPNCRVGQLDHHQESQQRFIDAIGYRFVAYEPRMLERWPCPRFEVFGGPRERLFYNRASLPSHRGLLLSMLFSLPPLVFGVHRLWVWKLCSSLDRRTRRGRSFEGPNLAKLPLIRWRKGLKLRGAPHQVNVNLRLSSKSAVLMHRKFDRHLFRLSTEYSERRSHAAESFHYRKIAEGQKHLQESELLAWFSVAYLGPRTLERFGLMRGASPLLKRLEEFTKTKRMRFDSQESSSSSHR